MHGTGNTLASALVSPLLDADVARELWERGGRATFWNRYGAAPMTAREVKNLPADEADRVAGYLTDADVLNKLWLIDNRVRVRNAISRNPHINSRTAIAALEWNVERNSEFEFQLVERAGVDPGLALLSSLNVGGKFPGSMLRVDCESPLYGALRPWALSLGVDRIASLASQEWAGPMVAWMMLHGVSEGLCSEDDVDQIWGHAFKMTQQLTVSSLLAFPSGLSRRWLLRLQGHANLCAGSSTLASHPFLVEAPELLIGLCDGLTVDQFHVCRLFSFFYELAARHKAALERAGMQGPDLPSEVATRLLELSHESGIPFSLHSPDYGWLLRRASVDAVPALVELLKLSSRQWDVRHMATPFVESFLSDWEIGDSVVDVLLAARATKLIDLWVTGKFELNRPSADAVKLLLEHLDVADSHSVAVRPDLWAESVETACVVASSDVALARLVESEMCTAAIADALLACAENREVQVVGAGWERNVLSALEQRQRFDSENVFGGNTATALLKNVEVPERLRASLAIRGHASVQWFAGHFELNPVTHAALDEERWTDEVYLALAMNSNADVDLRARAVLRLSVDDRLARTVAGAGKLDECLLRRLAVHDPHFAGYWLGGSFSENPAPSPAVALEVLSQLSHEDARSAAACYAESCGDSPDPQILEWLATVRGLLTMETYNKVMYLVGKIVSSRLGNDIQSWLLFTELGVDSSGSINEVLDLVAAARG